TGIGVLRKSGLMASGSSYRLRMLPRSGGAGTNNRRPIWMTAWRFATDYVEIAAVRIAFEGFLHQQGQRVYAATLVGMTRSDPHPTPKRNGDHRRRSWTPMEPDGQKRRQQREQTLCCL